MFHKIGFWCLIACFLAYIFYPTFISTGSPLLVVNMFNEHKVPEHFRIDEALRASGSGQFSKKALEAILEKIPKENTFLVDLREESHGFLNGIAVSWAGFHNWANEGKSLFQIEVNEDLRLEDALNEGLVIVYLYRKIPLPIYVTSAYTEAILAKNRAVGYIRLPVTDNHRPSDPIVDDFIAFVKKLPPNSWLHFHCAAGWGRTSVFLVMYDMIRNAKNDSIEAIFQRQVELGGFDFRAPIKDRGWRTPLEIERKKFLEKFYEYCKANPKLEVSWSTWIGSLSNLNAARL